MAKKVFKQIDPSYWQELLALDIDGNVIGLNVSAAPGGPAMDVNVINTPDVNMYVGGSAVSPTNPVPVELYTAGGSALTIEVANANLQVQLDHSSVNPDSVQVGDGSDIMNVTSLPYYTVNGDDSIKTVKSSAGVLCNIIVTNPNTFDCYVQFFDDAAPTLGTDAPYYPVFVPAGQSATRSAGIDGGIGGYPLKFNTAITFACTTTPTGDVPPTSDLIVSLTYK